MLYNKTKKILAMKKTRIAKNFFQKLKGLMFESKKNFDYALIFEFEKESRIEASIHMCFVFFPISLIYLDSGKKITEIVQSIKPFALNYTPKKPAKYLIELPTGFAKKFSVNDRIEWKGKN